MTSQQFPFLASSRLGYAEKGMLALLLSEPLINNADALVGLENGSTSVTTILKALEKSGHLHRLPMCGRMHYISSAVSISRSEAEKIAAARIEDAARASYALGLLGVPNGSRSFVYLISAAPDGLVKIGSSNKPPVRLKTLQSAQPIGRTLTLLLACPTFRSVEFVLHALFATKRVNGEWFRLNEADIESIPAIIRNLEGSP